MAMSKTFRNIQIVSVVCIIILVLFLLGLGYVLEKKALSTMTPEEKEVYRSWKSKRLTFEEDEIEAVPLSLQQLLR